MSDINHNSTHNRRTLTGYFLSFAAVITCPCHVPILIVILSGSAAGAFLTEHFVSAVLLLTGLFILSLTGAIKIFGSNG
jgi:mercuric ion transport protein